MSHQKPIMSAVAVLLLASIPLACGGADTGPDQGSGAKQCTGIATLCDLRLPDSPECSISLGCSKDGDCGGLAESCSLIFTLNECVDQDGCTWDSLKNACKGFETSCSLETFDFECKSQAGCHWDEKCTGSATPCSLLTESDCLTQPGCRLE